MIQACNKDIREEKSQAGLILTHHFTTFSEILVLVNGHAVRPGGDISNIIRLLARIEHGAISVEGLRVRRSGSIDVEVVAKTLDPYSAEDAEDISLMVVEF